MVARSSRYVLLAWLVTLAAACDKTHAPELPPAEVYVPPANHCGTWRGEIEGVEGTLELCDPARTPRGKFAASGIKREYLLKMERVAAPSEGGAPVMTNLVKFEWQDGRGDRGSGWLLINREGSALTGSFGRGEGSTTGAGEWTFVREGAAPEFDAGVELNAGV